MKAKRILSIGRVVPKRHFEDMSLIAANLRQTPWERIVQHSRALETARLLRAALEKRDAKP